MQKRFFSHVSSSPETMMACSPKNQILHTKPRNTQKTNFTSELSKSYSSALPKGTNTLKGKKKQDHTVQG